MARYAATNSILGSNTSGSTSGSQVQAQSGNQNQTSTSVATTVGSSNQRDTVNISYLDPTARKALNDLISQLSSGGTPEQKQFLEQRFAEILTNQNIRDQYSKANAFSDATGAMNQQAAQTLNQLLPQITANIDAAGTSGGSLQALLTQTAAQDAANNAAALGLNAAVQYGQIQAGLSGVLEQLTRADQDPIVNSLIQALNIAKGATETGTRTSSGTNTSTTTTVGNINTTSNSLTGLLSNQTTNEITKPNTANTSGLSYSNLNTPSSNRSNLTQSAAYQKGKTSYSQFAS